MSQSPTTIIGNVTDDPKLTFTGEGTPRLNFGVAINHYWTDASGEKQEKTSFINVIAWRYLAENLARVAEKGIGVIVQGRLEQRSWDDKETGQKRSTTEIVAEEIGILARSIESLERRRASGGEGGQQKSGAATTPRQPRRAVSVGASEEEPF